MDGVGSVSERAPGEFDRLCQEVVLEAARRQAEDPGWRARVMVAVIMGNPKARLLERKIRTAANHLHSVGRQPLPKTAEELAESLDEGRVIPY